jgi:hypothetical protein
LVSDKVFFHFFENILNGHRSTFVVPPPRFLSFYRISQCLPSKKFKKISGLSGPSNNPGFVAESPQDRPASRQRAADWINQPGRPAPLNPSFAPTRDFC